MAVEAGVDALGFVFYEPSPRNVSVGVAKAIVESLPPFVTTVGLFVNASEAQVNGVLADVPLSLLQFHGDETPEFCGRFSIPWIKALRMAPGMDVAAEISRYGAACGILLDAWHPEKRGGTGEVFDWARFPVNAGKPLVLAGGLTPDNIAEAIRVTRPYAVDVSGGVEASKGIKDPELIRAFVEGVQRG